MALLVAIAVLLIDKQINHRPGCPRLTQQRGLYLIAHAGGGMRDERYANSIAAMNTNYARGHRVFELDILRNVFGTLVLGHDMIDTFVPGATHWAEVVEWMRRHPDTLIITDVKYGNVDVLREIATGAGPLRARIIPQFYQPEELEPISQLGFHKPIFTLYRNKDPDWRSFAEKADLMAVTVPIAKWEMARGMSHPIFVHTVNNRKLVPTEVKGVYTDCFVPNLSTQG
jgi:glycerophosphoryl diester phosphodiesterase